MTFEFTPLPRPLSADETVKDYAHRLEELGFDEMLIRKALLLSYKKLDLKSARIFNNYSDARIRYVTMIHRISPAKSHKALVKKLAASIGISEDEAEQSVSRYEEVGEMPFVPWTRPRK